MTDLGTLDGFLSSEAFAINDLGQIVGASGKRAFIWESGMMTDLNDLLVPNAGWDYLFDARDINNNGQITGTGVIDGDRRAYVLTPIPEPGTLLLFALGALVLRKWN